MLATFSAFVSRKIEILVNNMADMSECNLLSLEDSVPALENAISEHQEELTIEDGIEYDVEIFIEGLQKFECLWNTSRASYKDRNCKMNAWQQLGKMFNKDGMFYRILFKL
jgi:hypothetical protein